MTTSLRFVLASLFLMCSAFRPSEASAPLEIYDVASLHVERYGAHGSPVILIPGLACGAWVWKDVIGQLQRRHQVYAVTLAGFDGRAAIKGDGIIQATTALRELISSRHIDRPVLVGHSLGGTLAILYAESHSDSIRGVIAVDGLPVFPGTENLAPTERRAAADRVRAQLSVATQAQFEAQQLEYMRHIGVMSETEAQALSKLTARSDPAATAEYAAEDVRLDLRPALPAIAVPVLAISPFNSVDFAAMGIDENGKAGYYRMLLTGVQQLSVVSISPSRHFVMVDQFDAFMRELNRFLDAEPTPSGSKQASIGP
jgi:pimeloyl-ACP methyl ester carboxylesterase